MHTSHRSRANVHHLSYQHSKQPNAAVFASLATNLTVSATNIKDEKVQYVLLVFHSATLRILDMDVFVGSQHDLAVSQYDSDRLLTELISLAKTGTKPNQYRYFRQLLKRSIMEQAVSSFTKHPPEFSRASSLSQSEGAWHEIVDIVMDV